ncbi:hypothetical protein AnigIFM56816_000017 [Aspergillus niger]|nr:hypothetical protein AnigIFM56816_000017 [Aspergillus niger]
MGDENEPTLNRTEQCMVLVFAALSIILTTYGIGYHQETVPTADMIMMEKYVYILFCLYLWVALAVKCSLTVFIMRVFPTKWIRRIGLGIMVLMAIVTVSGELPLIFQCWPVQAAWDSTIPNSKCFSNAVLEDLQLYQAILMLLFDVSIITLPMPTIWKLQMPVQRRLFIIGLFCLVPVWHAFRYWISKLIRPTIHTSARFHSY